VPASIVIKASSPFTALTWHVDEPWKSQSHFTTLQIAHDAYSDRISVVAEFVLIRFRSLHILGRRYTTLEASRLQFGSF
jgi:hypothetical protein